MGKNVRLLKIHRILPDDTTILLLDHGIGRGHASRERHAHHTFCEDSTCPHHITYMIHQLLEPYHHTLCPLLAWNERKNRVAANNHQQNKSLAQNGLNHNDDG